jgi:Flp pilus assembly CpaF family ATPase
MSRRLYVVCGGKGGSGATSLAIELANRLNTTGARVLVDGDLGGRRSHAVSFDATKQLDGGRAPGFPAIATTRGVTLFELSSSYEQGFAVRLDAVESSLAALPADAVVVVDAPQPCAAAVRPFVLRALRFVIVVEPTLLGVSGTSQLLAVLTRFGVPAQRITVVVNARDSARQFSRSEIQNVLGSPVAAELPPATDRRYAGALSALVSQLNALPELEPLPGLRMSASLPIGERRATPREPGSTPAPSQAAPASSTPLRPVQDADPDNPAVVRREQVKSELHAALLSKIDFNSAARADTNAAKMSELRAQVNQIATELVSERRDVGSVDEGARLTQELIEEALGLGPIEPLMADPDVTEVMVNGSTEIYIERRGKIELTAKRFADDRQVRLVIERILTPLGRRIDESSPMVDARLPDGSRVNAIIEPLSIDGPMLTIRRFGTRRLDANDLVKFNALTPGIVDLLKASVEARLNIVLSGGTGSGKTTLLNIVSSFIPRGERILTIEDAAELSLNQPHVIRLESRPANMEGRGEVRIRDLLRNALRMRPDRIIIGECRGGESLDMLQAMNTGHDGSITTVHANSPRDAMSRIETMVLMAGFELPIRAVREQMASAVDLVVQLSRLQDGSRKVTSVSEVIGMEGDLVTMQEIANYRQRGLDGDGKVVGEFEYTGVQPMFLKRFVEMGVSFDTTEIAMARAEAPKKWLAR